MEYRTQEQAIEIYKETYDGNWKAAKVKLNGYGFHYWEFIDKIDSYHQEMGVSEKYRLEILRTLSHLI